MSAKIRESSRLPHRADAAGHVDTACLSGVLRHDSHESVVSYCTGQASNVNEKCGSSVVFLVQLWDAPDGTWVAACAHSVSTDTLMRRDTRSVLKILKIDV